MKINNRLIITSGLLLALSTVAMSTATYAWFTVEKTASMTATASITAEAGVEIGLIESGGHTAVEYDANGTIALGSHKMTDISGNGVSLFKPVFASDNESFSTVNTITYSSETNGYKDTFITAALKFRSNAAYSVYIGESTDLISGDLAVAARMALFDGGIVSTASTTPSIDNLKQFIYSGDLPDYYISSTSATSSVSHTGTTAATGYTAATFGTNVVHSDVTGKYASKDAAATGGLNILTTLAADGGEYTDSDGNKFSKTYSGVVIVTIWIEGADPDCTNDIIDGSLSVTLPFQFLLA